MVFGLLWRSRSILALKSVSHLLFSSVWKPLRGQFGLLPFITGTLWVTVVAMIIAVPISLLTSIYLSEYAPRRVRDVARPIVDLLAGLPSVVFGVWGVLMVVPFVSDHLAPLFGSYSSGYSILAGGIVLAIMVFPTIIHVSLEVFTSIPHSLREASLSLGATRWETVKHVVLRKGGQGIIAATVLGVSRAFGETMAVLMVVGNIAKVPKSVFEGGYPLPALIANNYGEMMSVPLYDSALMLAALVLLLVVLGFNILARIILVRAERKAE
jgi:phosphate transport system permease protein